MKKTRFLLCLMLLLTFTSALFYGCTADVSSDLSDDKDILQSDVDNPPEEEGASLSGEEPLIEPVGEGDEREESNETAPILPDQEKGEPPSEEGYDGTEEASAPAASEEKPLYREPVSDYERYLAACATAAVRVRRGAGTGYGVLFTLPLGESLPYLWREGKWIAVWTGERVGYLSAAYAFVAETNRAIERMIGAGLEKLGTPYEWGAPRLLDDRGRVSPYFTGTSFDCSSFVQYCYYIGFGIKLGSYTGSQADYTVGIKICDYADLKRGDFYFTGTGKISHVVIYLGGGKLLQTYSANGGPVSITSDERWKGKFLSGRRPDPTVIDQFG